MSPLRPALALLLATALLVPAAPAAQAAPAHARNAVSSASAESDRAPRTGATRTAAGELIVRLKGEVTADKLTRVYRAADTSAGAVDVITADMLKWEAPAGESVTEFAAKLESTGEVDYAEPNYIRQPAEYTPPAYVEPNDPAYLDTDTWGYQNSAEDWTEKYQKAKSWWIRDVKGIDVWRIGYTGSQVAEKYPLRADGTRFKVGVIDTGLYMNHPDRSASMIGGGADFAPVDPSLGPYPRANHADENTQYVSHGTCVAGIVGASVGNGVGTLGIGNDTQVVAYKVYNGGPGIEDADIIAAVRQAVAGGCKIINMSIAGGPFTQGLQDAIDYAWGQGCVVVAASGNDGASSVSYPAAMNHVVAVGALAHGGRGKNSTLDGARVRADYSNYGSKLDMSAPGSWIWGLAKPGYTDPDDGQPGYKWWNGTSMASPVVAGGIALLWRAAPWMTNAQVIALMQETADDLGAPGRDDVFGHGAINLERAYQRLISDYPLLRKPMITVLSGENARNVSIQWTPVPGSDITYDVKVDNVVVATGTKATRLTLPYGTSPGEHVVTVTARSPRNWADGSQTDSVTIRPSAAIPEVISLRYHRNQLLWADTETGRPHTDRLSIDGGPSFTVSSAGRWSTDSLAYGSHAATLTVRDEGGTVSEPVAVTFTVRPQPSVKRITASDRHGYAAALSRSAFATATTAVLVGSGSWMDAFSAAPLAHVVRGPVLVSSRDKLPSPTLTELERLGVREVIVVGDTKDVSNQVTTYLAARGYSVSRISGSDRYLTANGVAAAIAKRTGGSIPGGRAVVVGDNFTYALAASAVAAREGWPLLYTRSSGLPASTGNTLASIGVSNTLVVGGTTTVPDSVVKQLPAATRIRGANTLSAPAVLADWAISNNPADFSGERVYLASSRTDRWMNSLGLPAAAAEKGGLVLATTTTLAAPVAAYYRANSEVAVTTLAIAGGKTIADSALNAIKGIVGAP